MFPIRVPAAIHDRENPHSRYLLRIARYICVLLALVAGCPPTIGQVDRGSVDWIFVLDTSASMHGAGGTANIFGKVKEAISDFIRSAREGDTITLYTFDRDTTLRGHIRISGEIDKTGSTVLKKSEFKRPNLRTTFRNPDHFIYSREIRTCHEIMLSFDPLS